ncbi:MAG: TetR/AcrR family transcriptional regulator [Acidimicrobiales bacterium]|nr:TetR/AcrR family transcriptional regulator [Acidimicrobiales bacterium]
MPRLWTETIASHRQTVTDTVLDAAASLVAERGVSGLTMAELADASGIGRATLYKYFPSLDAVLSACHHRQVERHVAELRALGAPELPGERLALVLRGFAVRTRGTNPGQIAAAFHAGDHVHHARDQLTEFVAQIIGEAAAAGSARDDVPPPELARYCISALNAAASITSTAGIERLVQVVLAGMQPTSATRPARKRQRSSAIQ